MLRPAFRLMRFVWLLGLFCSVAAFAQTYTRIVVFGDSLSDTGNVAHLAKSKFGQRLPAPLFGYTDGRFTDGTDTLPAATLYTGVWVEQVAAAFTAKPAVINSLDGGTNYAYGDATTANGTSAVGYGGGFSVNVDNLGQQVSDYLATSPTIDSHTLFIFWGGANDLLNATSASDITAAVSNEIALVQKLISAGATDILVPNLPPLGGTPKLNGNSVAAAQATAAAQMYGSALFAGLGQLPAANPGKNLHLFPLDTFALFNGLVTAPAANGLDNVTAKAQGNVSINPDRYLFWDDLHPTTTGHHLLAQAALKLLTPAAAPTTTTVTSSAANSNLGAAVTLTATVTASSGSPAGTVTFLDGTTTLGAGTLVASGTATATTSFQTSSLTAGAHSITASYAGNGSFASSTSAVLTETITAPAISYSASSTSLTIARGSTGTTTITATPIGGFSGTVSLSCGTLPAHMSCSFSPATLALSGNNTAQTSTLTIGTQSTAALRRPALMPGKPRNIVVAGLLLPGCLLLSKRRRIVSGTRLLFMWAVMLLSVGLLGVSGCGGSSNTISSGTYPVTVNLAAGGSTSTISLQVTVQ